MKFLHAIKLTDTLSDFSNMIDFVFVTPMYTLGSRLTTYVTYDRPHLRPQKKIN
jgi:hypothetical protein